MNNETEKLVREVEEIKALELQAEVFYTELASKIAEPADRELTMGIASDEQKHARMAEAIITMLRG